MTRIWCCIRPHQLEPVKSAIAALGISGMNVADVRGVGNSPETARKWNLDANVVALPVKSKVEVVVPDELVDEVVASIIEHARTGESGDGKIFIEPMLDAIRIRTNERGDAAL